MVTFGSICGSTGLGVEVHTAPPQQTSASPQPDRAHWELCKNKWLDLFTLCSFASQTVAVIRSLAIL